MSRFRRVVWNEGMLIMPHHFQQWDNYHEDMINSRLSSLIPYEWGILDLQLNRESLANGFFEIVTCRAVMPDGLLINISQTDPSPDPLPIQGRFDPAAEHLDVYLAVPSKRAGAPNFYGNGSDSTQMARTRYLQLPGKVIDETTGENEQQISFARGNLRLLFSDEKRDGYSSIKIAQLERTTTGQLSLSENYIPPSLNISASSWLINMLRQLVEILVTKSSVLGEQRRQRATSLADFTTSEVAIFWLLHTVNSAIPTLAHLFRTRIVHPERLYYEMARLAGELITFATNRHPKNIVTYDHENLYLTFSQLIAEIRDLLETVIPTKCVPIPLENIRESLYVGRVQDEGLLKEAAFYFGVRAKLPESQLIERVPRMIKIAARDEIDAVVGFAMPGVTLMHASPPPAPIPSRVGFHYFSLDSIGPFWEHIRGSMTISVYVPDEFPEVKIEMYAIKP